MQVVAAGGQVSVTSVMRTLPHLNVITFIVMSMACSLNRLSCTAALLLAVILAPICATVDYFT